MCGINYSVTDVGTGPAVMLLHGFPNDHLLWKHQVGDEEPRCSIGVSLTRMPCCLAVWICAGRRGPKQWWSHHRKHNQLLVRRQQRVQAVSVRFWLLCRSRSCVPGATV